VDITSDNEKSVVRAHIRIPSRKSPETIFLRVRDAHGGKLINVNVNGKEYGDFDADRELVLLTGLAGEIMIEAFFSPASH